MSEALIGVIIGGLLLPITQGIGFLVTRHFKERDEEREARRKTLIDLQKAILELVGSEQRAKSNESALRAQAHREIPVAMREIRLLAARVGDDVLWELVHKANPDRMNQVHKADTHGELGDEYDAWNTRIRKLFAEGK